MDASRLQICCVSEDGCCLPQRALAFLTHTARVCLPPLQGLCPGLHASAPAAQRHGRGLPMPAGHRAPVLSPPVFPPSLSLFLASRFLPTCSHSPAHHTCVLRHFPPASLQLLPAKATRCRGCFRVLCPSGRTPFSHTSLRPAPRISPADPSFLVIREAGSGLRFCTFA